MCRLTEQEAKPPSLALGPLTCSISSCTCRRFPSMQALCRHVSPFSLRRFHCRDTQTQTSLTHLLLLHANLFQCILRMESCRLGRPETCYWWQARTINYINPKRELNLFVHDRMYVCACNSPTLDLSIRRAWRAWKARIVRKPERANMVLLVLVTVWMVCRFWPRCVRGTYPLCLSAIRRPAAAWLWVSRHWWGTCYSLALVAFSKQFE